MTGQKDATRGLLATIAITAGVVAFGVYALDLHAHTCANCGHKWRHLGAFNLGDEESHTCARCGQVQWWKCGAPHVLQGSRFVGASPAPQNRAYGRTPPSLPYERMGYEQAYDIPSRADQENSDCEFSLCEENEQAPPHRLHEQPSFYRPYARSSLSRSPEESIPYYMQRQERARRLPSPSYEHRSSRSPYDRLSMSADLPYEREMPRQVPSRLTYERPAPHRAYASLMPGTEDLDECR